MATEQNTQASAPAEKPLSTIPFDMLLVRFMTCAGRYFQAEVGSERETLAGNRMDAAQTELNARYKALVTALRKYGRHGVAGMGMCELSKHNDYPCTCGLDALLAQLDATEGA